MVTGRIELPVETVSPTINGDKYWLRPFHAQESYERVRLFESRKLENKLRCGLELWRAKLKLEHTAWYPYLWRCGISQPTASRRKALAEQFLNWAGILKAGEELTESHVVQGLELVNKPFTLNDFGEYLFQLNRDTIANSLQKAAGGSPPQHISLKEWTGLDLQKVLGSLRLIIEGDYRSWSDERRQEVGEALQILAERCQACLTAMNEFEATRKRKTRKRGKGAPRFGP